MTIQSQLDWTVNEIVSEAPYELSGYAPFHRILRALFVTQTQETFYLRLRVLIALARWHGTLPTAYDLCHTLQTPLADISTTLQYLRATTWLAPGDRTYTLTPHGRIAILHLQLMAQPWEDQNLIPIATELYETARRLNVHQDLLRAQFDMVLATLEERTTLLSQALTSETTSFVRQIRRESARDAAIAGQALALRQQGVTDADDHAHVQRMHHIVSHLIDIAAQIDHRYQHLLRRDLLAEGLVTLGDINAWARSVTLEELADTIAPHAHTQMAPLWSVPERALTSAFDELSGRTPPMPLPPPPPLAVLMVDDSAIGIDVVANELDDLRAELCMMIDTNGPTQLGTWVDQPIWESVVLRFISVVGPEATDGPNALSIQHDTNHIGDISEHGTFDRVSRADIQRRENI